MCRNPLSRVRVWEAGVKLSQHMVLELVSPDTFEGEGRGVAFWEIRQPIRKKEE